MRLRLVAILLLAGTAMPAVAQSDRAAERRIERLEQELRAVQRRVFPGGAGATVEPEIQPQAGPVQLGGVPASSVVADLTARVDALEAQLATLTGRLEEYGYRLRQVEEQMAKFRADAEFRLNEIEQRDAAAPQPVAEVAPRAPATSGGTAGRATTPAPAPATGDAGEDAYLVGYRLWESGQFTEAQAALEAAAKAHPKHRRASYSRNLAGRAALDAGKPATAAKLLLANYQTDPKGERAADSLYFLGQALVELKRPAEACKVYDELQDVYGSGIRDWIRQRLPKARADAKCG